MGFSEEYRDSFIQWSIENGTKLSEFITVKDSNTGGTGVFFNIDEYIKQNGAIDEEDPVILMRVPKRLTLSLDSIAEMLLAPQLKYDLKANGDYIKQGQVFQVFLSELTSSFQEGIDPYFRGGLNETNILVGEIQILTVLKKIRDELISSNISDEYKKFLKNSPFARFDRYIDLLYHTDVNSVKLDEYYDLYKNQFKYNQREYRFMIEKTKNLAIYNALNSIDEDLGFDPKDFVDIRFLQKIEISVISRILEIPEALKPRQQEVSNTQGRYDKFNDPDTKDPRKVQRLETQEDGDIEDGYVEEDGDDTPDESEKYGFAVASTMVPVIDFVNHSNDKANSNFDVDKETKDVLLKYNHKDPKLKGEVELFITYSEYEDVFNFINAYGFVPKSNKTNPFYEHAIDRDFVSTYKIESEVDGEKYEHNLGNVLKWLGQAPNIQFVLTYEGDELKDVKLNLDQNFIIFGFTKGLSYDPAKAFQIIKDLQEDGVGDDFIQEVLDLEESASNDTIDSEGLTPYKLHGVEGYVDLFSIIENTSDEEVNNLMIEFVQFLLIYFRYRIKDLDNGLLLKAKNLKSIITQFGVFEREILRKFIEIAQGLESKEQFLDFIIGAEELDVEWLKYRLNPRYVSFETKLELQKKYMTSAFTQLGINPLEDGNTRTSA
ncbi:hypothetical protein WICANDRAFT_78856 [Wickerhamomyces anomalus NRRL Y-366-8]|uniref:SET domain-containing protein n=1 Tax=Wickerhamomyces anomalus (strain ATCC 58044 / CBS 1984 / NCYC 433 / NRRL Y-366-8) TaxID=683960 RepID=A0A1E3P422_WICAA|nr:uncharacterized protein WICANDRAFT_78856 [Wickerhamomyces anomalus NRRL Y-366-8]ODQ60246.1 hypothetical protein WICANDRAFT_78856 [Wickerhamomyces anomalus NRRL Y-366-8]